MKIIITTMLCYLSIAVMAQGIQLDSIIHFTSNNIQFTESFEYEDGLLSKSTQGVLDYYFVYDDQKNIISYEKFNDGVLEITRNLEYNENNQLIFVEITKDNQSTLVCDLSYIDEKLNRVEFKIDLNGAFVRVRLQDYNYIDNTVTTDYYSGSTSSLHSRAITEEYDDQGRLVKIRMDYLSDDFIFVDSLVYNSNGNLETIFEIDYTDPLDIKTEAKVFTSDASINFADILSPVDFFETRRMIANYGVVVKENYGLFYGNKIDNVTSDDEYSTWMYSISTSNLNERMPAVPISVYPNPSQDFITVQTEQEMVAYDVYDMQGKLIQTGSTTSNVIDVSSFTAGKFTIVCMDQNKDYYFAQFVKQ